MPSPTAPPRRLVVVTVAVVAVALAGAAVAASYAGRDGAAPGGPTSSSPAPADGSPGRSSSSSPGSSPGSSAGSSPGSSSAAAPSRASFPTAATTGVPAGTTLTPSGSVVVTEPGTVLDALLITGTVTVKADDVQIRRTRILSGGRTPIRLHANNLLVEDSEIDGQGGGGPAVGLNDYVLRRVDIHDVAEGPRIAGGDVVIEDSFIHDIVQVGGNHTDAVQIVGGDHITLRGNAIEAFDHAGGSLGNAAVQIGEEDSPVSGCLVEGNLLDGGNYTVNAGGGGTTGAVCTFEDNVFGRTSRFGPAGNIGPHIVWAPTNVWLDTGSPVAVR